MQKGEGLHAPYMGMLYCRTRVVDEHVQFDVPGTQLLALLLSKAPHCEVRVGVGQRVPRQ